MKTHHLPFKAITNLKVFADKQKDRWTDRQMNRLKTMSPIYHAGHKNLELMTLKKHLCKIGKINYIKGCHAHTLKNNNNIPNINNIPLKT